MIRRTQGDERVELGGIDHSRDPCVQAFGGNLRFLMLERMSLYEWIIFQPVKGPGVPLVLYSLTFISCCCC